MYLRCIFFILFMAIKVGAEEFQLVIPSEFKTELQFEVKYGEEFSSTQVMLTEVLFNDHKNYRMINSSISSVKPEFATNGLNLLCNESEKIVVDGQALTLQRQSDNFQGEIPNIGKDLEAMIEDRCGQLNWRVSFATEDDIVNSLGRLHGLVAIVGTLDFLNHDMSAFAITKPSTNLEFVTANILVKKDSHQLTLQKWEHGWRLSDLNSTYSSPSMTGKYNVQTTTSGLELNASWTKTAETPESRATVRMRNIQFAPPKSIELSQSIANGTPVSLRGSPQIKAVWMNGKVVRVYEGGTVDDLGSASFRTMSGSNGLLRIALITVCLGVVGGAAVWLRRKSNYSAK